MSMTAFNGTLFDSESSVAPIATGILQTAAPIPPCRPDPYGRRLKGSAVELQIDQIPPRYTAHLNSDSLRTPYAPRAFRVAGSRPHPNALLEPAALAAIPSPMPTTLPLVSLDAMRAGQPSEAQLEALIYCVSAWDQWEWINRYTYDKLDKKEAVGIESVRVRAGFLLADDTGVGKTTTQLAAIYDGFKRLGHTRAIYVTKTKKLMPAVKRQWVQLGGKISDVFFASKKTLDSRKGIAFMTYATLRRAITDKATGNEQFPMVERIIDWLHGDSIIILDEADELKHAVNPEDDGSGSVQGRAALYLQLRMPEGRFMYASATSATTLQTLRFAERLGLWGQETDFANSADFVKAMGVHGLAGLEMIAHSLTSRGRTITRSLSMEGVEYERRVHVLAPEEREAIRTLQSFWRDVRNGFVSALKACGHVTASDEQLHLALPHGSTEAINARRIESGMLSSINQALGGFILKSAIPVIETQIAQGLAPVVQFSRTGQAAMQRAKDDESDPAMGSLESIRAFVTATFPQHNVIGYDMKAKKFRHKDPVTGTTVVALNVEAIGIRDALLARLETLRLPLSPFDVLHHHFGARYAENTGRTLRVNFSDNTVVSRSINGLREMEAFQRGERDLLAFSLGAGGVGVDYHDVDGRRRALHVIELAAAANVQHQAFGRVGRAGQKSDPLIILWQTDVPGEARDRSQLCRKLASMGAITRGDRRASGSAFFHEGDELEGTSGAAAMKMFATRVEDNKEPGLDRNIFAEQLGFATKAITATRHEMTVAERKRRFGPRPTIRRFLNRTLGSDIGGVAEIGVQDRVIAALSILREEIQEVDRISGRAGVGEISVLRALETTLRGEHTLFVHPLTGAVTKLIELDRTIESKTLAWNDASSDLQRWLLNNSNHPFVNNAGFYADQNDGALSLVIPYPIGSTFADYSMPYRRRIPDTRDGNPMSAVRLQAMTKLDLLTAKERWLETIALIGTQYHRKTSLITGDLLQVWNTVATSLSNLVYATTDDGRTYLGMQVPNNHVAEMTVTMMARAKRLHNRAQGTFSP